MKMLHFKKRSKRKAGLILALILAILVTSFAPQTASAKISGPSNLKSYHAYVVIDAQNGKVLMGSNYNKKVYPASTTKLMTAIVILERAKAKGISLKSKVTIKKSVLKKVEKDLTSYKLKAGKKYTLETLINMMLISSYGDATYCAATYVFGSTKACVTAMNKKVKTLGLKGTHFDNVGGLDVGNNYNHIYTTALDMAKITLYASKNATIASIIKKPSYVVKTAAGKTERKIVNSNKLLYSYPSSLYTVIGAKTGTTIAAGRVLSTIARDKEGHKVICVYMGSSRNSDASRFTETKKLLNRVFKYRYSLKISVPQLTKPILTTVENTDQGIKLTWSSVKSAQKYRVYRKSGTGSWVRLGDVTTTKFTDKSAECGTTYSYAIRCVTTSGKQFQGSASKSLSLLRLTKPVLGECVTDETGVTLSWQAVAGATEYRVYLKDQDGNWQLTGQTDTCSYTQSWTESEQKLTFTVQALAGDSVSTFDENGLSCTGPVIEDSGEDGGQDPLPK